MLASPAIRLALTNRSAEVEPDGSPSDTERAFTSTCAPLKRAHRGKRYIEATIDDGSVQSNFPAPISLPVVRRFLLRRFHCSFGCATFRRRFLWRLARGFSFCRLFLRCFLLRRTSRGSIGEQVECLIERQLFNGRAFRHRGVRRAIRHIRSIAAVEQLHFLARYRRCFKDF